MHQSLWWKVLPASRSIPKGLAVGLCLVAHHGAASSVPSSLEAARVGSPQGMSCVLGSVVGLDAAGGCHRLCCGVPAVPCFPGVPPSGAAWQLFRHVSQTFAAIGCFAVLLSALRLAVPV